MAEMTAAEAIRMALKFNQFDVAGVITRMTTQLDGMKQKESAYKQAIESKKALIEQQAQEIERLNQTWPNSCDFKDDDGCCLFPGAMTPECHADACSVINGLKQEIERLNKSLQYEQHRTGRQGTHAEGCYKWGPGHWDCAMREIAKRGRMIEKAIDMMENNCCDAAESFDCEETNRECRACWREWLEKEAEVEAE